MKRGGYKSALLVSLFLIMMLGGCGMDTKKEVITKAIESHLQEKYGEEFEVLSWNQPITEQDSAVERCTWKL